MALMMQIKAAVPRSRLCGDGQLAAQQEAVKVRSAAGAASAEPPVPVRVQLQVLAGDAGADVLQRCLEVAVDERPNLPAPDSLIASQPSRRRRPMGAQTPPAWLQVLIFLLRYRLFLN